MGDRQRFLVDTEVTTTSEGMKQWAAGMCCAVRSG